MDGAPRQLDAVLLLQQIPDFPRSPIRPFSPQLDNPLLYRFGCAPRNVMTTPTTFLHPSKTFRLVPIPPRVSGATGNLKLLAELFKSLLSTTGCYHELHPLFWHFSSSPRHPRPLTGAVLYSSPRSARCRSVKDVLRTLCEGCHETVHLEGRVEHVK